MNGLGRPSVRAVVYTRNPQSVVSHTRREC